MAEGIVIGQPQGAEAGMGVLAEGGNAVDAAVTAALVAGVCALPSCGIGGYGGSLVIGLATGKVSSIDFNSDAPSSPPDKPHSKGWLAAGVPGTLAGLDLALHRYGTKSLRQCLQPAIRYASEGFPLTANTARAIAVLAKPLAADPGSRALYFDRDLPKPEGAVHRNPALAKMLYHLARENSTEPFYRGRLAREVAKAFATGGGRVTEKDMNAYEAREERPLRVDIAGRAVFTTPLTSGGLTVLQALASLPEKRYDDPLRRTHARAEALRLAWQDRLTLLGDPRFAKVPVEKLLSREYAQQATARIHAAVEAGRAIDLPERTGAASGTIHITAADAQGNMAALTLTHGDGFGACVTVPSLGLTLGHGMSRFEDFPGHPNAIGPRKRPLHNMCPVVVLENGRPTLALGGTGGRRIPNAIFDVLANVLLDNVPLDAALAAPRMNTLGGRQLILTPNWNSADVDRLRSLGFSPVTGGAADVKAVHNGLR